MLNEEIAEVVKTISRIAEKVQLCTDRQKEASKKIQDKINETEQYLQEKKFFEALQNS
jgi:uncharacterized coiled-coil protein SlyX